MATQRAAGAASPDEGSDWRAIDFGAGGMVWLLCAALILVRSHYFGFLSDDSNSYLALAQNLVDGRGWHMRTLGKPDQLFAIWPVGYPSLIGGLAQLTGVSVFAASKWVNILLVGANLVLLKSVFARHFPWFACLLLLPPWVEVSSYTWSEVPFFTGMLWLAVAGARFLEGRSSVVGGAMAMVLATALMFLSRYIGALGVGVLAVMALAMLLRRERGRFVAAALATVLAAAGIVAYLWMNLQATGQATGMPRLPAPEPAAWLAQMTVKAHVKQLNILVTSVDVDSPNGRLAAAVTMGALLALAAYVARGGRRPAAAAATAAAPGGQWPPAAIALVLLGLLYLAAITVMRWRSHFDSLNMRLLTPGTLLVLAGLLLQTTTKARLHRLRTATVAAVMLGLVVLAVQDMQRWQAAPETHAQREARSLAAAASIPAGAVVVLGEVNLSYLRPDLLQARPMVRPLHPVRETWNQFLTRVHAGAGSRPVYVFIEAGLNPDRYDPSVLAFMAQNHHQRLLRLDPP